MKRLLAAVFLIALLLVSPDFAAAAGKPADSAAAAYSQNTILYLEVSRPVENIDAVSRMSFWPETASLLDAIAASGSKDSNLASALADAMRAWAADPALRRQLEALAGNRLAVGIYFPPGLDRPEAVIAASGKSEEDPAKALKTLAERFLKQDLTISSESPDRERFEIADGSGKILLRGARAGEWLVFGNPSTCAEAQRTAAALSAPGAVHPEALSNLEAFREAMASLPPASLQVRGFVNTAALLRFISEKGEARCPMRSLAESLLNRIDGLGFARNIKPDSITTWIVGRVRTTEEDGITDFLRTIAPMKKPLLPLLPDEALSVYEIGAPPGTCMGAMDTLIEEAFPRLHVKISGFFDDFRKSTGLDPASDLFPHLGGSMAVAVLPAEDRPGGVPFPRPVFLARVETVDDEPAVRAFLSSYFRWEAGAVAAMTEGFVSARPVSGAHNGVELMGLQPEGVFPMPLPSPTCGLVDGVLVFSPFRSAAEETIDSIRSRPSPIQGQRENIPAPDSVPATGAVERFHISLPGWGAQLEKLAALVPDRNSAPLKPPVASFLSAISRILGALGPVDGATTMREDGTFSCRIEIKPVRSDKQR